MRSLPSPIERSLCIIFDNNSYYWQSPSVKALKREVKVSLEPTGPQWPSAQNNSHAKVARLGELCSEPLWFCLLFLPKVKFSGIPWTSVMLIPACSFLPLFHSIYLNWGMYTLQMKDNYWLIVLGHTRPQISPSTPAGRADETLSSNHWNSHSSLICYLYFLILCLINLIIHAKED